MILNLYFFHILHIAAYFFFYKHYELKYEIKEENEIAKKGNEILRKYLQERKYGKECDKYNKYINMFKFINFFKGKSIF